RSAPRGEPVQRDKLVRKLPWIEAIGTTLGVCFFYFILDDHLLAELFAIMGALVTFGRLGYTAHLEGEIATLRQPLERMQEYLDISAHARLDVFRDMLQLYSNVTEEEFNRVKDGILTEARSQLLHLANEKKSAILPTTTYYGWLLPMLERAM